MRPPSLPSHRPRHGADLARTVAKHKRPLPRDEHLVAVNQLESQVRHAEFDLRSFPRGKANALEVDERLERDGVDRRVADGVARSVEHHHNLVTLVLPRIGDFARHATPASLALAHVSENVV